MFDFLLNQHIILLFVCLYFFHENSEEKLLLTAVFTNSICLSEITI